MASNKGHRASDLQIDVQIKDHNRVGQFRRKRAEWFQLFESDEPVVVSIRRQLLQAIVDDLTYRVFTDEIAKQPEGHGLAIPSLRYLLNVGYVTSQSLLARRLLDTRKDVSSIARILRDIRKNRRLITRENFVSYDGTPYDPDLTTLLTHADNAQEYAIFGLEGPTFSDQLRSHHRHERFDKLSQVQLTDRTRTDLVDVRIFETLESWLSNSSAEHLKTVSDSYFAHATDGSNSEFKDLDRSVAPLEVEEAQRAFVRSSRAIFDVLLNSENYSEVVPHISLGSFGTVWSGQQLIESTARMQRHWDEMARERNRWGLGIDEALYNDAFGLVDQDEQQCDSSAPLE